METYKEIQKSQDFNCIKSKDIFTGSDIYHIVNCIVDSDFLYQKNDMKISISISNFLNPHYTIEKFNDEWFLLYSRIEGKIYKCDQIDGLVDCLRERIENPDINTIQNLYINNGSKL